MWFLIVLNSCIQNAQFPNAKYAAHKCDGMKTEDKGVRNTLPLAYHGCENLAYMPLSGAKLLLIAKYVT